MRKLEPDTRLADKSVRFAETIKRLKETLQDPADGHQAAEILHDMIGHTLLAAGHAPASGGAAW